MYMNNHVHRAPFSGIERKKAVAKSKECMTCMYVLLCTYCLTPQFSRLGTQVSLAIYIYMFVCLGYGWVGYTTCIYMCPEVLGHIIIVN